MRGHNISTSTADFFDKLTAGLGKPTVKEVTKAQKYVAPEHGVNSPEYVAKQIKLGNEEMAVKDANTAWKNAPATVTTTDGKKVPNTVLGDSAYVKSLKIDSAERYNELLKKKAFHPGNPEIKKIAKQLGITAHKGEPRKPRSDKGIKRTGKDPFVDQTVIPEVPLYNPNVSPADAVMSMAFGGNSTPVQDYGLYTYPGIGAPVTKKVVEKPVYEDVLGDEY